FVFTGSARQSTHLGAVFSKQRTRNSPPESWSMWRGARGRRRDDRKGSDGGGYGEKFVGKTDDYDRVEKGWRHLRHMKNTANGTVILIIVIVVNQNAGH